MDLTRLALLGNVPTPQDAIPPAIELKDCTDDQDTFLNQVYLQGVARDEGGVGFLAVNGQPILKKAGKNVYFSYLAKLDEGRNCFRIEARNLAGNVMEKTLCFNRKLNKVREVGSRLSVALLPARTQRNAGLWR